LSAKPTGPAEIVAFWREAGQEKWFKKDEAFDRAIREGFAALHAEAAAGKHDDWAATPDGALALILLFDQFSRNLFRGSPETYVQDERARGIASRAIEAGFDLKVDPKLRAFFYMPFMHSESLPDLDRCVALSHPIGGALLKYAKHHRDIVRRFGRFPHRNAVLGRHTTPAEQAFLDGGGFSG
jgi:uncharacterized protein (DUF924 family)